MARINVDQTALSDPRYQRLARIIGCDHWGAIGRMLPIWNYCQEHETYHLTREEILDIHPDRIDFADAIISARLGEENRHGIYIKGTKGRIEWLAARRELGRKFGHLGGPHGKKGGRKSQPSKEGTDYPSFEKVKNPPPAPAPAPAPSSPNSVVEVHSVEKGNLVVDVDIVGQPKAPRPPKGECIPYQTILDDLNGKAGTKFKAVTKAREMIAARWKEGFREEDFFTVHSKMVEAWFDDPKMRPYIRPVTLYSNKFDSYRNRIGRQPLDSLSEAGRETYLAGQEWLRKEEEKDAKSGQGSLSEVT